MSIVILFFLFSFFFIFVLNGTTGSISRTEVRSSYHAPRVCVTMDIIIITFIVVIIPLYGPLKCHPFSSKALFYRMWIHFHVVNTGRDWDFRYFWGIFPTLMVMAAAHMANWHY